MVAFFAGLHYQGCGEFHPYTVCDSRDGSLVLAVKALGDCTIIYEYRRLDAAPYMTELQEHADHQALLKFQTIEAQEDPRPVFALLDDVQSLTSREVYMCGPPLFVRAFVEELHRRGVSRSHLHFEEFDFRSHASCASSA